jgi:6-pyruvoyltetrahydropterin/6-carboxytetrahydropterin synthase
MSAPGSPVPVAAAEPPALAVCTAAVSFEAACHLPLRPAGHRTRRMHGHSYRAHVRAVLTDGWAPFPGCEEDTLHDALAAAVAPLDYALLNDHLAVPTDEHVARWVRRALAEGQGVPAITQVGVQSTAHAGAELDAQDHAHLWRRYRFEAAHWLPNVPAGHPCGRLHGHGFEVVLHATQAPGAHDPGADHDHLDACWAPLHAQLHLGCLNDLPGLENPTAELLTRWIWDRLKPVVPGLSWVSCHETGSSGAHYDGARYRIWKALSFDSALRLAHAPATDARRRVHGHTFTLRLHLAAPLDEVLGWTVDFGDVKQLFAPVLARLDHHPLHELPDGAGDDLASLARWIRAQAAPLLPALERIDLEAHPGCGVLLAWGAGAPALPV